MTLPEPEPRDEPIEIEEEDTTWGHPETLGLVAFVLAALSLLGGGVFRGIAYTLPLAGDSVPSSDDAVDAAGFVSVGFALVPVVIARIGLGRLVPSDGPRAGHLLRAAFLLGLVSVVLHLVLALLELGVGDNPLTRIVN